MNAVVYLANIDTRTWFIGQYRVKQVELELDDLAMVASPVFGGPLVHLFKTSVRTRRGGLWTGTPDWTETTYTLNLLALGPEDGSLVLDHLGDLLKAGKLELPEHESFQRYRHEQLEPVEEWFTHPRGTF